LYVSSKYSELNEIIDNLRKEFHEIIRNHEVVEINKENWLPAIKR
jgi:hypothetical protein